MGEVGQRLVHRLPGGPHQLRDLFLCQVVGDPHGATLLGAEPLGQLQQLLGHPAGHVGEDEIGQIVVGAPQPSGQHAQQLLGDLGAVGDPRPQRVSVHRHRAHLGDGGGAGSPRARVEDRQFAEHVRRAHDGQQILASIGRAATDLHLPRDDDVQPIARFPLGEDCVSTGEVDGLQLLGQCCDRAGLNPLEDSCPCQDLVHVASSTFPEN